jgi:DNA-binding MarR family transcriptional regulator
MTSYNEPELAILEGIGEAEKEGFRITQRELASRAGLSLGMTNALLRQFAQRGWIKLTKLSTRSVVYAITPAGLAEIARRTAGFFYRASRNSEKYRGRLEAFILEAKAAGVSTIVLAGASELDFLLEYLCERHGLVFVKSADPERACALGRRSNVTVIYADSSPSALFQKTSGISAPARLSEILGDMRETHETMSPGGVGLLNER